MDKANEKPTFTLERVSFTEDTNERIYEYHAATPYFIYIAIRQVDKVVFSVFLKSDNFHQQHREMTTPVLELKYRRNADQKTYKLMDSTVNRSVIDTYELMWMKQNIISQFKKALKDENAHPDSHSTPSDSLEAMEKREEGNPMVFLKEKIKFELEKIDVVLGHRERLIQYCAMTSRHFYIARKHMSQVIFHVHRISYEPNQYLPTDKNLIFSFQHTLDSNREDVVLTHKCPMDPYEQMMLKHNIVSQFKKMLNDEMELPDSSSSPTNAWAVTETPKPQELSPSATQLKRLVDALGFRDKVLSSIHLLNPEERLRYLELWQETENLMNLEDIQSHQLFNSDQILVRKIDSIHDNLKDLFIKAIKERKNTNPPIEVVGLLAEIEQLEAHIKSNAAYFDIVEDHYCSTILKDCSKLMNQYDLSPPEARNRLDGLVIEGLTEAVGKLRRMSEQVLKKEELAVERQVVLLKER